MNQPHSQRNETVYVLGFAFTHDFESVVLIEKQKPEWQRGFLNGVGGKVERSETIYDAMTREFAEETGVDTRHSAWVLFHTMRFRNGAVVHCFATKLLEGTAVRTVETEQVGVYMLPPKSTYWYSLRIIRNLSWLVPMAAHQLSEPESERMI